MPLSISKFLLESLSTTLEGTIHSFFINWYPLPILYRPTEAIIISENQSIVRSIDQSEVGLYTILWNGPEKSGNNSRLANTEKTEFEAENRKLENWKAEKNQVCYIHMSDNHIDISLFTVKRWCIMADRNIILEKEVSCAMIDMLCYMYIIIIHFSFFPWY
jgi:hypothetical protein